MPTKASADCKKSIAGQISVHASCRAQHAHNKFNSFHVDVSPFLDWNLW